MNFSVRYRDNSGALLNKSVEAANHAECVTILKEEGLVVVSIQESKVVRRIGKTTLRFSSRVLWISIITISLIMTLAGVWLWCGNDKVQSQTSKIGAEKKRVPKAQITFKSKMEPAPVKTNVPVPVPVASKTKPIKEQKTYIDSNGIERYPGGMRVRKPAARTIKMEIDPRHRFKYVSETQIAGLLEIKPGTLIVGDMKYSNRFVEDFKASLEESIEILETDSEYDKQLKSDVIEAKKQLKAALDKGEDIAKIMTDTRNELKELGQYRENIKQSLQKLRKDGEYTENELEEFTASANKLLAEKGCQPIKLPAVLIRFIREKQEQAQQNQ